MKYLKILGLAAIAAAALMAFAGSASATTLTSPAGTTLPAGTVIKSQLKAGKKAVLKGAFGNVECEASTLEGKTANTGSSTETVHGAVEGLTFTKCNCEVVVLKKGELEIHTLNATADGNGTVTASGQEVTTKCNFFGIEYHCIWKTSGTDLGTLTGGTPAVIAAQEAVITREGGNSGGACGSTGKWTAEYEVTSPSTLLVD
ncbi:MAG: hypothetical protein ACTHK6_05290 [Solirubrobacterales bacterium]